MYKYWIFGFGKHWEHVSLEDSLGVLESKLKKRWGEHYRHENYLHKKQILEEYGFLWIDRLIKIKKV